MSHDVSVVGLYILDVLGRPITHIPPGASVEFIEEIRLTVAGTAGGTCVDVAKLGLDTLAVGGLGQDEKADFVLEVLKKHGVDTSGMQQLPEVPTSATILNVRPNGERPALHCRGASDEFLVEGEMLAKTLDSAIVHLGGTGLLRRMDGEPSRDLLKAAKQAGRTTTFDLIAATEETLGLVTPLLPYIDYFMPSDEEARAFFGNATLEDTAKHFLDEGVQCCAFTCGADGAFYSHQDGTTFSVPAYDIDVVDTTGCGDAFSAGMIAAIHHQMDPETAMRFAQAAAALVATGLGSDAGIVSFEQTVDFMNSTPLKK